MIVVRAVLCPDPDAFLGWCQSHGYVAVGDGAESVSGTRIAIRVVRATDLDGVTVDRVDYAVDFWRKGERGVMLALEALARTRLRSSRVKP